MSKTPEAPVITIFKNADWRESVEVLENDAPRIPVDLTGASIEIDFRRLNSNVTSFEASTTNGRVVLTDAKDGRFEIALTRDDLFGLSNVYQYDVVATWPGPIKQVLWFGRLIVKSGVTT